MAKDVFALRRLCLGACLAGSGAFGPAWGQNGPAAPVAPEGPTGLRPPTLEEQAWMDENLIIVDQVLPNGLAHARVQAEQSRQSSAQAAPLARWAADAGSEIRGHTLRGRSHGALPAPTPSAAPSSADLMALPRAVDNSTENWFPPIGSQRGGSCASFSTTYYTMTSQVARLRNWDVKHDNNNAHKFSTKFTYNLINGGGDNGSWITTAYSVMQTMGCATYQSLPYSDNNFVSWPTTAAVWREAIAYRMSDSGTINAVDTDAGLALAKQMLANGFILNYATDIYQWQFTDLKNDPGTPADDDLFSAAVPAARRKVCSHLVDNGGSGHGMTIVGYHDDVWTDLNNNGVVDPGEKGAFRIANSWGNWQDGGYVWIAYDALKAQSAVAGGPNPTNRKPGFWYQQVYWISARPAYAPSLVAEITATHGKRNQMTLMIGRGASSASAPTTTWTPSGLNRQGGALAFDGTSVPVQATFVVDCTDLLNSGSGSRWFATMKDNTAGDAGTLSDVRFVDATQATLAYAGTNPSGSLPQPVDNGTLHAFTDYSSGTNLAPVAQSQTFIAAKNQPKAIALTATDANGDALTYRVVVPPNKGSLSGTAPALTYTPSDGASGTDSFTFKANDGKSDSNTATVSIAILKSLDLNSDGAIDVLDLAALASAFGKAATSADLDSTGLVDDADLSYWLAGF